MSPSQSAESSIESQVRIICPGGSPEKMVLHDEYELPYCPKCHALLVQTDILAEVMEAESDSDSRTDGSDFARPSVLDLQLLERRLPSLRLEGLEEIEGAKSSPAPDASVAEDAGWTLLIDELSVPTRPSAFLSNTGLDLHCSEDGRYIVIPAGVIPLLHQVAEYWSEGDIRLTGRQKLLKGIHVVLSFVGGVPFLI